MTGGLVRNRWTKWTILSKRVNKRVWENQIRRIRKNFIKNREKSVEGLVNRKWEWRIGGLDQMSIPIQTTGSSNHDKTVSQISLKNNRLYYIYLLTDLISKQFSVRQLVIAHFYVVFTNPAHFFPTFACKSSGIHLLETFFLSSSLGIDFELPGPNRTWRVVQSFFSNWFPICSPKKKRVKKNLRQLLQADPLLFREFCDGIIQENVRFHSLLYPENAGNSPYCLKTVSKTH